MGGGVDEPGGVESEDGAEEDTPEEIGPSAEEKKREAQDGDGNPMPLADPDVELVFAEVGDVGEEFGGVVVHGFAGDEPADMGPESSFAGRVRVAFLVGVLVMLAVGSDPEDGSSLEREAAAGGDEVFDPLWGLVAAMGKQAMVGHADADVDCEEVHDNEDSKICPRKEEESGDGSDVEEPHGDGGDPVDAALLVLAAHAEVLLDLLGDFGDVWNDGGQLGCFYRGFFNGSDGSHLFAVLVLLLFTLTGGEMGVV